MSALDGMRLDVAGCGLKEMIVRQGHQLTSRQNCRCRAHKERGKLEELHDKAGIETSKECV